MNRKLRSLLAALLCAVMLFSCALADRDYLIPDSDTRKLTRQELWKWNYESLGYILNEIFARHGYVFQAGGKYDNYFSCMPWYTPNADRNNSRACYPQMNSVEWYNESLIKSVRQEMRSMGTTNPRGKSVWDSFSPGFETLSGFEYVRLQSGQKLAVYSAPGTDSWRGANGKAAVSTDGRIYAAGWDGSWLLVMYETNRGSVRVGYVNGARIRGSNLMADRLRFSYQPATVLRDCRLTDDPARSNSVMRTLRAGTPVTYLTTFYNRTGWDYVETTVDGQTARGFIPKGYLDVHDGAVGAEEEPGDTEEYEDGVEEG